MNELIYSIWLQQALKYGNSKAQTISRIYESALEFYRAGEHDWRLCGCFSNREINNFKSTSLESAAAILERSKNLGFSIITIFDKNYPYLLSQIPNPPCVIYVKGDVSCLYSNFSIAVVGTRSATNYGKEMAFEIAHDLAAKGAIVVSGGAMGVDSAAHSGAIAGGGKTIAVLGCGIDYPYLMGQAYLRDKISKNGALISEYPPGYKAFSSNFPIRNRIISGLSLGAVVIEAGERSGSLITANIAAQQNRDVFVVPVEEASPLARGVTSLIQDGAKVVTCAQDIIDEYPSVLNGDFKLKPLIFEPEHKKSSFKMAKVEKECELLKSLTEQEKTIYEVVKEGKIHIDDISIKTKIKMPELMPLLTQMELLGAIRACSGGFYETN